MINLLKRILKLTLFTILFSSHSVVAGTFQPNRHHPHPWHLSAGLGMAYFTHMYAHDGETPLGRLAIGRDLFAHKPYILGAELGVQSGNTERFDLSQETLDFLGGGLPLASTAKPMLDLLAVGSTHLGHTGATGYLKAGIAYRHFTVNNRETINDLIELAPELQVGISMPIAHLAALGLYYQGVFSGNPTFTVDEVEATGFIRHIPTQHAVLLMLVLKL